MNANRLEEVLKSKFTNYDYIVMNKLPPKPGLAWFYNAKEGCELLDKHIMRGSRIAIHADVDLDGLGSGLIMHKFLNREMGIRPKMLINKDKCHGILEDYAKLPVDLLIIVDSSSNKADIIRSFPCDVLVIDHHIIDSQLISLSDLSGSTKSGSYYIINNTIPNTSEGYKADSNYSAGLTVYEFLRCYLAYCAREEWIFRERLYQWAVVTLISDIISMDSARNQYYANLTMFSNEIEPSLSEMLLSLSKYNTSVTKSTILYKLAPRINRAIRAGAGAKVLDIMLNNPASLNKLDADGAFKQEQDVALELVGKAVIDNSYVYVDITGLGVRSAYAGIIASKSLSTYERTAVAFCETDGLCKGSFRGRYNIDYRTLFQSVCADTEEFAQGHTTVFGFALKRDNLLQALSLLKDAEAGYKESMLLTAGPLPEAYRGQYHIPDLALFRKLLILADIGIMNGKLASKEELPIYTANSDEVVYKKREYPQKRETSTGISKSNVIDENNKKSEVYDVSLYGISGVAFEPLTSDILEIYIEFSSYGNIIVKNHSNIEQ